jgi:hypothetical protein
MHRGERNSKARFSSREQLAFFLQNDARPAVSETNGVDVSTRPSLYGTFAETLDQVANRVHTTPEQCLMSITTIARQARGGRLLHES